MRRVARAAMSSISSVVRARTTPNSASTAAVTASSPAMEAVWLRAAWAPTAEVPTFIMMTGLRAWRAASRAASRLSDSRMPSA